MGKESAKQMLDDFDPNAMAPRYVAATYCPTREPEFKVYTKMQYAKNAFGQHGFIILYEWNAVAREWDEVERKG